MPERIRGSASRPSRLQFRGPPHKRAPGEESVLLRNVCQRIALGSRRPRCHRVPKKLSLIDKPHSPRLPLPESKPFARLNGFGPLMSYANWRNVKKKKKEFQKSNVAQHSTKGIWSSSQDIESPKGSDVYDLPPGTRSAGRPLTSAGPLLSAQGLSLTILPVWAAPSSHSDLGAEP